MSCASTTASRHSHARAGKEWVRLMCEGRISIVNWRAVTLGAVSAAYLVICAFFAQRDPRNDLPSTIAFIVGVIGGAIIVAAHAKAKWAEQEYSKIVKDGDTPDADLWSANVSWITLVVAIAVPALAIWISPLRLWPHGAFYGAGMAVEIFVFTPIFSRNPEQTAASH